MNETFNERYITTKILYSFLLLDVILFDFFAVSQRKKYRTEHKYWKNTVTILKFISALNDFPQNVNFAIV